MKKEFALMLLLASLVTVMASNEPIERTESRNKLINYGLRVVESPFGTIVRQRMIGEEKVCQNHSIAKIETNVKYNDDGSINIPFIYAPTEDDFTMFKVIDNNNDGRTWIYDTSQNALQYRYSVKEDADDYVILPAIRISETDNLYLFSIDAAPSNDYYGESFEMCVSRTTDPDDFKSIFASGMIYGTTYSHYSGYFSADTPGNYYVAVRATSPKNGWRLYVQNLAVEKTDKKKTVPNIPTNISVEAAPLGETAAIITFKMPLITASNVSLAPDEELTAVIESAVEKIEVKGLPGTEQNVKIGTNQGNNLLNIYVVNDAGNGIAEQKELYTGKDIPSALSVTAKVSEDNMTLHLSWEENIVGKNGGYVNPAEITYKIVIYEENNEGGAWTEYETVRNATSYDYILPDNTPQKVVNLGVTASNDMGENRTVSTASDVIGTPYKLPVIEYFQDNKFNYNPIVVEEVDENSNATWGFMDPTDVLEEAANESGSAIVGYIMDYGESIGRISLPKISTLETANVTFEVEAFFHDLMPLTHIHVYSFETEEILIGTLDHSMGKGWKKIAFDLPKEFANRKWVGIYITSEFPGEDEEEYILIDKYLMRSVSENDLAVTALHGEKTVMVGSTAIFEATVENFGSNTATLTNATFNLISNGGETIVYEAIDTSHPAILAPGEIKTFNFEFTATTDMIGDMQIKFDISPEDEVASNNSMEVGICIEKGNNPIVTDLEATVSADGNGIDLNWSPIGKLVGIQDFESCSPFYYGSKIEEFKNYDGDKKNTYVMTGANIPGQGYPKAFQVFNYNLSHINIESYKAHSGEQCLLAMCPDDEETKADDWLISPAIEGGTEMSLFINIMNEKYSPEEIEILVSTTTDDIEAFSLLDKISKSTMIWEQFSFTLPDDAKYFAIRYTSFDHFGILIDDIDYIPAGGEPEVKYNIYRNSVLIAEDVDNVTYHDMPEFGKLNYNVSVKVDGTEYAKSNTVYIEPSGINDIMNNNFLIYGTDGAIQIDGQVKEDIDVYTLDGRIILSVNGMKANRRIAMQQGIYMVKIANKIMKVIVK